MEKGRKKRARKSRHEAEEDHGEELWIVSYADMVTLLFGFFVILYSFSTLDDKKFDQMGERMAEAFKAKDQAKAAGADAGVTGEARQLRAFQMLVAILNLGASPDDAAARVEKAYGDEKTISEARQILQAKIAPEHKDLIAEVQHAEAPGVRTVELVLPEKSLFPPGGYHLTKAAAAKLVSLAGDLSQVGGLAEVAVEGHTDGQKPAPGATFDDNFTLSSLRAGAVAAVLVRAGVDRRLVSVRGFGDLKPLAPERDADGHALAGNMARNRRVDLVLKIRKAATVEAAPREGGEHGHADASH